MAQWGTRYRIVFLGRHEENKTQLSSSISEEEVKAVKTEPLEIPEIKKRRRLSRSELKELKEASHYKKRPSSSKGMTKECNNAIERWTVERYKRAEQAMLEILKAEDATFGNPVSRRELRMAARKRIGDTGLLDHLLKHVDGKVAPGGTERFRRWFNTSGRMEYWLESADLANIRREARVHDPYWIPSSTSMPGGGPLDGSVSGGELKLLKADVDKMKSDIQELLLSQKQENDQANQERLEDLAKWKSQSEQSLKVILGSWKGMQDNFEELKKWKTKVERQVVEITNILSDMQGPRQNTVSKPEEPEQWEDWLESSNLDSFQGNELVPWFESTNNLVNSEEEVIIQDPYLALPLSSRHGDSSSQDLFCKLKEEMAEMERDVRELVPEKQREYQANLTPDSSATANSKSDLDNLVVFQEMFQELFNWKSTTEQKLSEISNSMNVMKQNPKLLTPPAPQLPEDGNHYKDAILQQVRRMLRISEKDERAVREYHEVHLEAKEKGYGRVFRSPTLFEDLVKCILLCNTKWSNTLKMARSLCELHSQVCNDNNAPAKQKQPINLKRKREMLTNMWSACKLNHQFSDDGSSFGNFPSAQELAELDLDTLQNCSTSVLGYRANTILKLAKIMRLDAELGFQESLDIGVDDLFQKLKEIKGFGSFSCANALMCMGYYHKVPTDTETIRHLLQVHGRKDCDKTSAGKDVEEIYGKYAPFQCLAYLSELLDSYEGKFGKLSELPASSYHIISGRLERKGEQKTMMN